MASRILLIDLTGGQARDLREALAAGSHSVITLSARWRVADCGQEHGADLVIARVPGGADLRKVLSGTSLAHPSGRDSETQGSSRAPAVLLVGPADATRRGKALELGAEDYLPETISPGYLLDRINNITRKRAARPVPPPLTFGLRDPEHLFSGKPAYWLAPGPECATRDMMARVARHAGALRSSANPPARSLAIVMESPGWRVPATAAFVFVTRQPFGEAARFALRCGALDVIDGAATEQDVLLRLRRAWRRQPLTVTGDGSLTRANGTFEGRTGRTGKDVSHGSISISGV